MKLTDFDACADWWGETPSTKEGIDAKTKRKNRQENEFAWKVSIDDIIARNYNLDIKNPHIGEVISHDPEELLADYAKQQADIQALRDQLKGILSDALNN